MMPRHAHTSMTLMMPRPMTMCSACRPVIMKYKREEDLRVAEVLLLELKSEARARGARQTRV